MEIGDSMGERDSCSEISVCKKSRASVFSMPKINVIEQRGRLDKPALLSCKASVYFRQKQCFFYRHRMSGHRMKKTEAVQWWISWDGEVVVRASLYAIRIEAVRKIMESTVPMPQGSG